MRPPQSFNAWLAAPAGRKNGWVAHFADDAKDDEGFPEGASLAELHDYLDDLGAMPGAHLALEAAWEAWSTSPAPRARFGGLEGDHWKRDGSS